jgi:hypothetical protein
MAARPLNDDEVLNEMNKMVCQILGCFSGAMPRLRCRTEAVFASIASLFLVNS